MARTKQTARRSGPGDNLAAKAATASIGKPSGKKSLSQKKRLDEGGSKVKSRIRYQVNSLREIRKAQKLTTLCIQRAPFIRVVRDISDRLCGIMKSDAFEVVKWQFSALACIQEAAEDFLIDFFNDSYIAAAFAHRVTLMVPDFGLVTRLRYRFDKGLVPIPIADRKAFDILNIPPARMPKAKSSVKIEDITHLYKTRKADEKDEERRRESEKEQLTEDQTLQKKVKKLSMKNAKDLKNVSGQIIVDASFIEGQEYYLTLTPEDKNLLHEKDKDITDSIVFICLRFALDSHVWSSCFYS